MRAKIIKKGRKGILHFPKLIGKKIYYTQRIAVSHSMTKVSDACDSGWSKLWGIAFGHHHLHSSYRYVFRNNGKGFIVGYYAYINGVSPQDNTNQKGAFYYSGEVNEGDVLRMTILITAKGIRLQLFNETTGRPFVSPILQSPKNFKWLRTELFPNLKCRQGQDTHFPFMRNL